MPIIEIDPRDLYPPDGRPELEAQDPERRRLWLYHRVLATMQWPRDSERRKNAALAMYAAVVEERFAQAPPDELCNLLNRLIARLIQGGVARHDYFKDRETQSNNGAIAGAMLLDFLRAAIKGTYENKSRIVETVAGRYHTTKNYINGHIWPDFGCVAHFWMAAHVLGQTIEGYPPAYPADLKAQFVMPILPAFLGLAETFRKWGEASYPNIPALLNRPNDNWRLPAELPLADPDPKELQTLILEAA